MKDREAQLERARLMREMELLDGGAKMGLFLEAVVLARQEVPAAKELLKRFEKRSQEDECALIAQECMCFARERGTLILLNEDCAEGEAFARFASQEDGDAVLYLHIHDEALWMYRLFCCGVEKDRFCPIPDYWEDGMEREEYDSWSGDAEKLERYIGGFHAGEVERYLTIWTDEMFEGRQARKAYAGDEYGYADCWQMADFLRRIGYPYPGEDELG